MQDKQPVRVAHIVGKALFAGVDTVVMNYARALPQDKVQFDLLVDKASVDAFDAEIIAIGGRVYRILSCKWDMLGSMRRTAEVLRGGNYKIVHCHMNSLSVFFLFAAWISGVPVRIVHSHSTASHREGLRALIKYALRPFSKVFATHYAACSLHAGRWLFGKRAVQAGHVRIIPNALLLTDYAYAPKLRDAMRTQLGLADKPVIGHVGRLELQKNHKFLLDIFAQIKKSCPDAVLLLAGDGSYRARLEKQAHKLGIAQDIHFLGLRRDVGALLQAMDVLVLPSFFEGYCLATLEAQAAGLRVFASTAIPEEANITGQMQFLSLKAPACHWAQCIVNVLDCDRKSGKEALAGAGYESIQAAALLASWYKELGG